jgi:hypothetical protein
MFAMAATLAVVTGIDVALSSGAPSGPLQEIAFGHIVFAALFAASGLLFRHASLAEAK